MELIYKIAIIAWSTRRHVLMQSISYSILHQLPSLKQTFLQLYDIEPTMILTLILILILIVDRDWKKRLMHHTDTPSTIYNMHTRLSCWRYTWLVHFLDLCLSQSGQREDWDLGLTGPATYNALGLRISHSGFNWDLELELESKVISEKGWAKQGRQGKGESEGNKQWETLHPVQSWDMSID